MLIGVEEWAASTDLLEFDRRVHAAEDAQQGPVLVRVDGPDGSLGARQILSRYQRCSARRNWSSRTPLFDRVLARHRGLHDVTRPLVRADFDHAVDAWQWVLRLEPDAGQAVQVAALFHDIERLESEPVVRVEQHAVDYQYFKDRHATRGAELMRSALRDLGLDAHVLDEAAALVATHERRLESFDLRLLNDADALSFFSLNSWGFLAHYGPEHSRKKVAYTLARMSTEALSQLSGLRLPPVFLDWL